MNRKRKLWPSPFHNVHKTDDTNATQEQTNIKNEVNKLIHTISESDEHYFATYLTNPKELCGIIKKLPNSKSPGEDRICNKVIKNLSKKATVQLSYIISAIIIKLNYFPESYKMALVIPVLKPTKRRDRTESYRPISLLNTISKIAEKVIYDRFNRILDMLKIKKRCQFGFKEDHSATQQVARIVNDILINFNKDKNTVMTLLDLEKAFDRIWIDGILHKMHINKIPLDFIKLISSYLSGRKLKVKINNTISAEKPIESRAPQGSILGPELFNFYIHDLTEFEKTEFALYADDTAIYAHSFYAQAALLQNQLHIHILQKYFQKWKLKWNESKTETILFTRKRTNNKLITKLKVNNSQIEPTTTVRYLGVHLDIRLYFKNHVKKSIDEANAIIKKLYQLIVKNNKILLYKTMIRPVITYAAPVWCHLSKSATEPLEVLQNKCLRLANNAPRYTSKEYLRNISGVPKIREHIRDNGKISLLICAKCIQAV
jgi:hypothetical protein